jgi:hypothetical protein
MLSSAQGKKIQHAVDKIVQRRTKPDMRRFRVLREMSNSPRGLDLEMLKNEYESVATATGI